MPADLLKLCGRVGGCIIVLSAGAVDGQWVAAGSQREQLAEGAERCQVGCLRTCSCPCHNLLVHMPVLPAGIGWCQRMDARPCWHLHETPHWAFVIITPPPACTHQFLFVLYAYLPV
jgi:hypothetical protein